MKKNTMTNEMDSGRIPWRLAAIFLALVLGISLAGQIYYSGQKDHIKQEKQSQLAAIANLKVAQIVQWRAERIADGKSMAANPFLMECISEIRANRRVRSNELRLKNWMRSFGSSYGYERVDLLDPTGKSLVDEESRFPIDTEDRILIDQAIKSQDVVFSDLHRETDNDLVYCDVIAPIVIKVGSTSIITAVILLHIDASEFLFPLIQSWPTPSTSSEALLVERDGDQILYLSVLRQMKSRPLTFRLPTSEPGLIASKAVADSEGITEGIDYRGVPVLASMNKIQHSPWRLIAKVDQDEVYASIQERSQTVLLFVILLIIAAGSSIALLWRHQRSVFYRNSLELELKRKVIEEHFDALMKQANDGIIIIDLDGSILDVNEKATTMHGWNREEFIGRNILEIVAIEARTGCKETMAQLDESNGKVFESQHLRKDGSIFPVEVSARIIDSGDERFIQNIVRDISDRKKSEQKLRDMERRFRSLIEKANDLIIVTDLEGVIVFASPSVERVLGCTLVGEIKRGFEEFLHADDLVATRAVRGQAIENPGQVFAVDHRLKCNNGTWLNLESYIKYVPLSSGKGEIIINARDTEERNRALEALRLSEEKFSKAFLASPDAISINKLKDGFFIEINEGFTKLTGHTKEEVVGKSSLEINLWAFGNDRKRFVRELIRRSELNDFEAEFLTKDGSKRIGLVSGKVMNVRNELWILTITRDITERKRAEEQLQLQKAYFQQLFESAPEAIVLLRTDERIIQVNREFTKLFGYTQEDVVDRQINDLIVPELYKEEGLTLSRRVAQGSIVSTESIRRRKDGTHVDVSILGRPVRVDGGQIALYAIYRDITDRKKAEEALRKSESSFRGLFNSVNDAIYIQDRDGRFLDVNQGAVKMYGYPREYFIGKKPADLGARGKNDLARTAELLQDAFEGEAQQFEFWGVRKNGQAFPKEIRISKGTYFGQEVVIALAQDITERKRFEAVLQETNRTLESLIQASPLAITVMNPECAIQLWNPAAERMFGWKADEVIGKFNPIVPEDKRDEFIDLQTRALKGETIREIELRRKKKDGTLIDISRSTAVIRDSDDKIKGVMAVFADITERKHAEEQLRESEERLRLALTGANMMSWELDLRTGKVTWSVDAERFYGLKANEFTGTRDAFMQLIHPDDRSVVELSMNDSIQQGKEYKSEFRIVWPDGTVHWHAAYGRASRDEQGRPVKVSGIGADITDRKRSEETIQKLHHAVEQTDEVIFMTEPDGVITYVNPAFEKLYRYSREEAIGKTPRVLKSGGMSQEYYAQLWRDLLAGKSIRAEHINKTKDGKIVIVEASVNSIYDVKGRLTGFIAVQEDISDRKRNEAERKRLEAQLLQTQKLESIGTLAGGIAHDFNNILGIILAYSSTLRNARLPFQKVVSAADIINQAVERGAELVKQILTFARKTDVVYGLVNINVMIKELRKMLSETFPRTISIATELGGDVPEITADATQVHQAILNICVNARDAMPAGGMMVLRTKSGTRSEVSSYFPEATSARYIRVSIADTGSGMDENTRQRIFEPFFTTKAKGKGTGLGLSVVYGVVKNHNGFVRVDSEIGRGTTFHLYFPAPLQSAQPVKTKQGSLVDIPGGTESILVVEDEEPLLNVLSALLKSKGYRVFVAHDGFEAVETYEEHHNDIAVVVSDLGLPRMTGQDAFLRMKSVNPKVKVIFGTGYLDPELKTELLNLGAKGFLAKPYSQDELLIRIRELIDLDQ